MAVTAVNEIYRPLDVSDHIDPDQIYIQAGRASRQFQVLFSPGDDLTARPLIALSHADIPNLWDAYPSYAYWFVTNRAVKFGGGPFELFVDIDYEYIEDPLAQTPLVTYRFDRSEEPIDRDIYDVPLTNSADEPFDPHVTKRFSDMVIRIEKNEAAYNPAVTVGYIGAVSSADWTPTCIGTTFAAGTVKCDLIDSVPARYGPITYFKKVYEFRIRDDKESDGTLIGWKRRLRDQGLRERTGTDDDGNPIYAAITDANGSPITTPVSLDGSGKRLTDGADAVFLLKEVNKTIDLNGLGL